MKIYSVKKAAKGHNGWCGPAALSIITGCDTAEAAAVLRYVGGRASIKGSTSYEMLTALRRLGYYVRSAAKLNPLDASSNPTLASWLSKTHGLRGGRVYLIAAGEHWQVVSGNRFCCGLTGKPVSLTDEKVRRRARVTACWEITQVKKVKPEDVLPSTKVPRKRDAVADKARRLAKRHDIDLDVEVFNRNTTDQYTRINVWGHAKTMDSAVIDDPYANYHGAIDWAEALEMVETYIGVLEEEGVEA